MIWETIKLCRKCCENISCYKRLRSECNVNKLSISKYVVLSDLERLLNTFRNTTPYEFDVVEFDYVCFKQLLMMEFDTENNKNIDFKIKIVNCEKKLMLINVERNMNQNRKK